MVISGALVTAGFCPSLAARIGSTAPSAFAHSDTTCKKPPHLSKLP